MARVFWYKVALCAAGGLVRAANLHHNY